jgi:hypothetical protein
VQSSESGFFFQSNLIFYVLLQDEEDEGSRDGWGGRRTGFRTTGSALSLRTRSRRSRGVKRGNSHNNKKDTSSFGHKNIEWEGNFSQRKEDEKGIDFFDPRIKRTSKRWETQQNFFPKLDGADSQEEEEDFQLRDCCDPCVTMFDVDASPEHAEYLSLRIDAFSRVFVPLLFLVFCAYYWPMLLKNA